MKNLTKTFKLFYFFLVLCFILVSISSEQRGEQNNEYWMDVVISPIDLLCTATHLPKAVLGVDTRDCCRGALIPFTSKRIHINTLEHCFNLWMEPLFPESDIFVQELELGLERNRRTGLILSGRFWLKDTNQKYYRTEEFEPVSSGALYSYQSTSIVVDQCLRVYPQTGRGKKEPLGYLTVGTIVFSPK